MIQLTIRNHFEPPSEHERAVVHKFSSPVGPWAAWFHDPFEWHMGAEGWQLSLLANGKTVTGKHRHIGALWTEKGFYLPPQYQPWCSTRPIIALHAWDNVVHLYDVAERHCNERSVTVPRSILWAPKGDKLAITLEGRVTVLDAAGHGFDVPIPHPRYELPDTFWWPDGQRFFVVSRTSDDAKTRLSFFDATRGASLASADFDPVDLVPYDQDSYRRVLRDRFSLHHASGIRTVGALLDTWSEVEFDPGTQLLRAVVYRPAGPCQEIDGEWTCLAEERGVEVVVSVT